MPVEVPPPQILGEPGVIRWAVGSESGPRSQTWMVVGRKSSDDVFIGPRERFGDIKLSLHHSRWRLAYTSAAQHKYVPAGTDRLLTAWEPTAEIRQGWQRAAVIVIAPSMMGLGYPEKPVKGSGSVTFYPPAAPGFGLRFDIMLGRPQRADLTINAAAEVGHMTLTSGALVWIVASEVPVDEGYEQSLAAIRQRARDRHPQGDKGIRGWSWGFDHDGHVPVLHDISCVYPYDDEAAAAGTPP